MSAAGARPVRAERPQLALPGPWHTSAAGARVGDFELLARLGAGGQGEVFLARPWAADTARRAAGRLLLRARLRLGPITQAQASRLGLGAVKLAHQATADCLHDEHGHLAAPGAPHPHLPRLYRVSFPGFSGADLGLTRISGSPRLYLALAYEAGVPLERLLAGGRRAPGLGWALAVAAQVAAALAHLHGRGVIHHDVRPANIVVRPGPHAVLLDLGAAEIAGRQWRRAVYGAPGWLPPERLGPRPAPASPLVDIYGLGLLLRALTVGRTLPPCLTRLIAEASAADPLRRAAAFSSVESLRGELLAVANGLGPREDHHTTVAGVSRTYSFAR